MSDKKLGEVVNYLSTQTELRKPEIAAKVRKLCSLPGTTIKRTGERISVV